MAFDYAATWLLGPIYVLTVTQLTTPDSKSQYLELA